MKIAVMQSGYLPWKGYFDLMRSVDLFITLDSVQYTRSDWRNRNLVKDRHGELHWLTIPILGKGRRTQSILEARVAHGNWARKHYETIRHCYSYTPYFSLMDAWLRPLYRSLEDEKSLSRINAAFQEAVRTFLGIDTPVLDTPQDLPTDKNERILELCRRFGATEYLCGPMSRQYLDERAFRAAGIDVSFMSYDDYPRYPQPGTFTHHVSIIDMLCHTGRSAGEYLQPMRSTVMVHG